MNILALDLGTKCGYASSIGPSGVWDLKPKTTESAGERYRKFQDLLHCALRSYSITFVVYEEVHAHAAIEAAHVFGGLQAILQTTCLSFGVEYKGVGVGTIKKHATGNGHSKKDAMIASASIKFKSVNIVDDNHSDALWLLDYALKTFKPQTTAN
jgi:Holliday junction resolvasome RuvABC endonuclease subunit